MEFARRLSYPAANESYTFAEAIIERCRQRAHRLLDRLGIDGSADRLVSIGPFANHPYKQAPLGLFHKVARHAIDLGCAVAMIGPSADRNRAEAFCQELGPRLPAGFFDLVGQLEWDETLGLLALSSLFISNDSGIMHVSLACRTGTVAFFGPTDPYDLVPRNNQDLHPVFLRLPCQPCWQKGPMRRFRCPEVKKACLEWIEAGAVTDLISRLLTTRHPEARILPSTMKRP